MSLVNSSDDIAYLPLNCFLTKVKDGEEPSFKLVELASASPPSFSSLNEKQKR